MSEIKQELKGEVSPKETIPQDIFFSVDAADLSKAPAVASWASASVGSQPIIQDNKENAGNKIWEYTVGDLHGNTLLAVWHLLRAGMLRFKDPSAQDSCFQALWELYEEELRSPNKGTLTHEEREQLLARHQRFKEILKNLEVNKASVKVLLRFLGDTIGDRGASDLYTFWLMDHLEEQLQQNFPDELRLKLIVGNHELYLLSIYQLAQRADTEEKPGSLKAKMLEYFHHHTNPGNSFASSKRLMQALKEDLITETEFRNLIARYKSRLQLIDYSFLPADSKAQKDRLDIYLHGKVGIEAIRFYAKGFGVPFSDKTAAELMHTINEINSKFRQQFQDEAINNQDNFIRDYNQDLWTAANHLEDGYPAEVKASQLSGNQRKQFIEDFLVGVAKLNPLLYGCEARGKDPVAHNLQDILALNLHMIEVPQDKSYQIRFVGGHHSPTPETVAKGVYSLDQAFGKYDEGRDYMTQGKVLVYEQKLFDLTQQNQLASAKRLTFYQESTSIYRKQKKLAYGLSSLGFTASIGWGTTFAARALAHEQDLAPLFLKIPDLSHLKGVDITIIISLIACFVASAVSLGIGYRLGTRQKLEEGKVIAAEQAIARQMK